MMALNHTVIAAINFVAILLSIPIIGAGIWLSTQADSSCLNLLQWPIIIHGVLILAVALAGFIGAFWRLPKLLLIYLVAMLLLILALAGLVVFIFVVTNSVGPGHLAPSRLFFEYELNDDSGWLKQRVEGSYQWNRIKQCLSSTNVCTDLNQTYSSAQNFFNSMLTPLQSGCCKPPTKCGYTYVNPTNWISPISVTSDVDCMFWSNDQTQLCYSCSSCKAGLLANVKREWRRVDLILVITLVVLICVYIMGCYAFRAAKTDDLFRRYKQGYT